MAGGPCFRAITAAGKGPGRVGLALVAFLIGGAAVAQAQECPGSEVVPRIILQTGFAEPTLDTRKSSAQLAAILASQTGRSAVGNAVGLTSTRPIYSFQTRLSVQQVGRQRYCVTLTDLTIQFKYENTVVYVARKYQPSSCPYAVTLDHEMRHVGLYRRGYERFLPYLYAQAEKVGRHGNPMDASSLAMAKQVHLKRIQKALDPLFQAFFKEQRERNLEMDTPRAYGRERDKCQDW